MATICMQHHSNQIIFCYFCPQYLKRLHLSHAVGGWQYRILAGPTRVLKKKQKLKRPVKVDRGSVRTKSTPKVKTK